MNLNQEMVLFGEVDEFDEKKSDNNEDMLIEWKIRIKLDSKVACMCAGNKRHSIERKRGINYFWSLLMSANKKILCVYPDLQTVGLK